MNIIKPILFSAIAATVLTSCGGGAKVLSTPIENIDSIPLKVSPLTDTQKHTWGHLDLIQDTIPGMSVDKAYTEIIKNNEGKTVIVAVIDSGIDIEHEDLDGVIWTNEKEVPGNGIDDDKNGFVDDVHGWNFLGDTYNEQLEFVRILATGDETNPDYARAKTEYDEEYSKFFNYKTQYDQLLQQLKGADELISAKLNKSDYNLADIETIEAGDDEALSTAVAIGKYILGLGFEDVNAAKKDLNNGLESISERLNYNLNIKFQGRKTGDNPDDLTDIGYGNGNVMPVKDSESHGTHVAGIIAAERNNGLGVNGVANNVKIMSVRAVPNGDEYDKDIALAIRYAVDNGAQIINGSFGKYYSPHSDWVRDAIAYASENDVLFVNAAGNEGQDLDVKNCFPNDQIDNGPEVGDTFVTVGALEPKYGPEMVAGFSNYGKINVDVFSPGAKIYSTVPGSDKYDTKGGTSMAAPAVAGVAALIRSQYPKLSAAQVKQVLMDSGLPVTVDVIVGGDATNKAPFADLSKSKKMVNAYNALILASKLK
ncbi:S8 family peptidase [Formosa algae]|uniref:Subtilisin family serine protease n=1 Tax=Formosa algae TaxID=225843 RepID=A0A9X1CAY4_9FLAO|nr:S8 family peptidase [Formosa algae]MBP1838655.1 subtilisin family serine protease [Formosa algae]MDQ0335155.1 subtilisin family serine protease [Formosa algae]OEI80406.1 peptidase S8 [Formosa algae]PNW30306.1 peptidase S8 [Formosa algae]